MGLVPTLKHLVFRKPGESVLRFLGVRVASSMVGIYLGLRIAPVVHRVRAAHAVPECTCKRDCKKCYP